jgi:hypothetical protein
MNKISILYNKKDKTFLSTYVGSFIGLEWNDNHLYITIDSCKHGDMIIILNYRDIFMISSDGELDNLINDTLSVTKYGKKE